MYSHHSKNGTGTATKPEKTEEAPLLEVDGWQLVRSKYPGMTGVDSYPYHTKCKAGVYRRHLLDHTGNIHVECNTCTKCGDPVPDEIHGMWTLHNWEVATK